MGGGERFTLRVILVISFLRGLVEKWNSNTLEIRLGIEICNEHWLKTLLFELIKIFHMKKMEKTSITKMMVLQGLISLYEMKKSLGMLRRDNYINGRPELNTNMVQEENTGN